MAEMKAFTLYRLGRIKNKWITDGLSEIMSTFMLALFVYASGAQDVLTRGAASSPTGRALAAGVGLMLAVYCGFNASGACVNPCIALMFCLTGKLQWKRYPVYVICEFTGAFLAACFTYGIYSESISNFDGGTRQMYGENATAQIFTSFPRDNLSKRTGFFDIFTGCGLLTGTTCMLIDPNNAKTASGVIPLSLVFLLYGILMSFGWQTGAPINLTIDFSGRFFAYCAGYGSEVFSRGDYWFWVPPVACVCGTLAFVSTYQLMIGNHLPMEEVSREKNRESLDGYSNEIMKNHFTSQDSVNTDVANVMESTKI
ncbi:aquaporin-10-like isoform X1 [Mercenaria mercenaria]|uniref:aquaporin-10-like isoform X1 n=2 Tax=Mercenaria mercenaria TaxID=6596 RepID=UPI00234E8157|nr:aquaporin-10-like isoform X1 [Mercenaria mercenaria]